MDDTSVFIGIVGGLKKVADLVGPVVGVDWIEIDDRSSHRVERVLPDHDVIMLVQHYEDDEGMPFSKFPFVLSVYVRDDETRIGIAREYFEKLKALNVPLMLINSLQVKLDEWAPPT